MRTPRFHTNAKIEGKSSKAALLTVTTSTTDGAKIQRTQIALNRKTIAQICEQGQLWMLHHPEEPEEEFVSPDTTIQKLARD